MNLGAQLNSITPMRRHLIPILLTLLSTPCTAETEIVLNGVTLNVDLAITESEHKHGLMGRTTLQENQGMLFIYQAPQQISFWMKATLIPLDILFFDGDGKLMEIFANTPPCKGDPCKTYTNQSPAQYVLELPAGTVERLKLKRGDTFTTLHR